jgi:hypothetical protein
MGCHQGNLSDLLAGDSDTPGGSCWQLEGPPEYMDWAWEDAQDLLAMGQSAAQQQPGRGAPPMQQQQQQQGAVAGQVGMPSMSMEGWGGVYPAAAPAAPGGVSLGPCPLLSMPLGTPGAPGVTPGVTTGVPGVGALAGLGQLGVEPSQLLPYAFTAPPPGAFMADAGSAGSLTGPGTGFGHAAPAPGAVGACPVGPSMLAGVGVLPGLSPGVSPGDARPQVVADICPVDVFMQAPAAPEGLAAGESSPTGGSLQHMLLDGLPELSGLDAMMMQLLEEV